MFPQGPQCIRLNQKYFTSLYAVNLYLGIYESPYFAFTMAFTGMFMA